MTPRFLPLLALLVLRALRFQMIVATKDELGVIGQTRSAFWKTFALALYSRCSIFPCATPSLGLVRRPLIMNLAMPTPPASAPRCPDHIQLARQHNTLFVVQLDPSPGRQ